MAPVVVDRDIEAAERFDGNSYGRDPILLLDDVMLERANSLAVLRDQIVQRSRIARGRKHVVAGRESRFSDVAAPAARAARDEPSLVYVITPIDDE